MADRPGESGAELDFESFFYAEFPRLVRAMYLVTAGSPSDAEEIAQEAMVRVYERWESVRRLQSPAGYLFMTAFNVHRRWRRFRQRPLAIVGYVASEKSTVAETESHVDLMRGLRQLSREQREAIILTTWLGFTAEEAADVLGIEASSVRGRVHRARQALRHHLGGDHV